MNYDVDEDILQDFLIEAGEILELLSEQLIDLENNPDDKDLLNAIFRGFHTVKGGAGFLSMHELVEVCHEAENIFDILRKGHRQLNAELMDVILQALDSVNLMFSAVQAREALEPADPALVKELQRLSKSEGEEAPQPVAHPEPVVTEVESSNDEAESGDEITQEEFEKLLDQIHGGGGGPTSGNSAPATNAESNDITDNEFEQLLDDLHGENKAPGRNTPASEAAKVVEPPAADGLMTDGEFEKLLDNLHGSGKGPTVDELDFVTKTAESTAAAAKVTPKQEAAPVKAAPEPKKKPPAPKPKAEANKQEKSKPADTTVRVDTSTLDAMMNMVGELVLVRNRLVSLGLNSEDEEISKAVANLDIVTGDIQGGVMKTRMQPIKKVFGRFPRVVRDLARSLKKEIVLEMKGEETDLDKNLVEALADPLVHLVRNSVDHGIEMPDVRTTKGKPTTGKIILAASQKGDYIELTISDDGGGMDAEKLRNIAIDKGILDADAAARISERDSYNLIFAPGFSTKKEISDISGRGVGMDVVKTSINALNGSIEIDSELGKGTTMTIKVPLTLAILPTLMVGVSGQPFAFPLANVNEIFNLDHSRTNIVNGQLTVTFRDCAIPLFYLRDWLVSSPADKENATQHIVIMQIGLQTVGFVVDTLIGQEEVVIKPLDGLLQGTPGMSGATITSNGDIALILDIPDLLKHYGTKARI